MSSRTNAGASAERDRRWGDHEESAPAPASVRFVVGGLGLVILLGLVAVYVWSTRKPATPAAATTPGPPSAVNASSKTKSPPRPRLPSIKLPTFAVPVESEQLQAEAEQVANQLVSRFPDRAEALHVAAILNARLRKTAEAERLWQQCREMDPDNEQYAVNLASVAIDRGNSELAAATLEDLAAEEDASLDVLYHLGTALTNLGRNDEAVEALNRALAKSSTSATHWQALGQAQLNLGRLDEAVESFERAIELGASSPGLHFALSQALARQGKEEEAKRHRERYTSLSGSQKIDPDRRYNVLFQAETRRTTLAILTEAAAVYAWQRDSQEAERLLLRAIALDPANIPATRSLAEIYRDENLKVEQRVVCQRLLEIEPQTLNNYFEVAELSFALNEPEVAEATLKLAIALHPSAAAPFMTLAEHYLQSGNAQKARWFAQEAVRRHPTPSGYIFLGSTCRALGNQEDAEAAFAAARELAAQTNSGSAPPSSSGQGQSAAPATDP